MVQAVADGCDLGDQEVLAILRSVMQAAGAKPLKAAPCLRMSRTKPLFVCCLESLKAAALKAYVFALTLGILKAALPPPLKAAPRAPARCPAPP